MFQLKLLAAIVLSVSPLTAQVVQYADLNTREIEKLDRAKTVVLIPGGILEEHGPYLPSGSDGIFNRRLTDDLAAAIAARTGWTALVLPQVPVGAGGANEIGKKYSFPGSVSVLPTTLRAVFMDLGDQLGQQGFRWIVVVNGHGDPAHNRMLDQAGDYFHDTYGGEMVNLFGYLWAMELKDNRTADEKSKDGLPEHATMTETSVILALQPRQVAADVRQARPQTGHSMEELVQIATAKDWPGYFGAPALATPGLGKQIYSQWLERANDLVQQVLAGAGYRKLRRYGDLYADDPGDAAAAKVNEKLEEQHQAWTQSHPGAAPASR